LQENKTNLIWQEKVGHCLGDPDFIASPRGMEVREVVQGSYIVPMPAFIDLKDRKVNVNFMFAEAAWIISGSNRLEDITPYMKNYANFSDDGVFLRGAYGPKVVDQLPYVVDTIAGDIDTRQAVITIWRERPGPSKDIPCTVAMQFLVRDGKLNMVTTMRSQDIVLGFTYDVFTFSMVAKAVQLLLRARGIEVMLGNLYLTAGSMHLYKNYYEKAEAWLDSTERDMDISHAVAFYVGKTQTYKDLISLLQLGALRYGEAE
jgi:thymidylate synthase